MRNATLHTGDCLEIMPTMEACSIDTIITDPPYGLSFMGKDWDHGVPGVPFWAAALRVAKPGALLLAFGGTRTWHRLAVAIEDAGWEVRDTLMWLYGQGFPKSHDISKAIDRAAGAEREELGLSPNRRPGHETGKSWKQASPHSMSYQLTAPATPAAALWDGWGTALKPAWEPVIVAMKPLDGTFAQNALRHGVAGLNIDGGRIGTNGAEVHTTAGSGTLGRHGIYGTAKEPLNSKQVARAEQGLNPRYDPSGRWPANVILDEDAAAMLDAQSGESKSIATYRGLSGRHDAGDQSNQRIKPYTNTVRGHNDTGGASRFFYVAKASRAERNAGLEGLPEVPTAAYGNETIEGAARRGRQPRHAGTTQNNHPTVKPLALMRYLCRLTATPTGGVVFDPFTGSGTTGIAALLEGRSFVGCELEAEYAEIARRRIEAAQGVQPSLLGADYA